MPVDIIFIFVNNNAFICLFTYLFIIITVLVIIDTVMVIACSSLIEFQSAVKHHAPLPKLVRAPSLTVAVQEHESEIAMVRYCLLFLIL